MKLNLFFSFFLLSSLLNAQISPQVIATGGNISQQGNAFISYTIGETVIQTATDGTTILTQGYQQPHYNITLLPQFQNTNPSISIFPNPTSDQLQIKFDNNREIKTKILLMDASGKQIQTNDYTVLPGETLSYPMHNYASGKYFITIEIPSLHSFKTFEIVKSK